MRTGNQVRLITIREAAAMLAVSPSTLYGWVSQRRIPFVKVGRALRFSVADLESYILSNRREANEADKLRFA
jgi:excisionase family DNA binding protein